MSKRIAALSISICLTACSPAASKAVPAPFSKNCYKNNRCVIKTLEKSEKNEMLFDSPVNGVKFISEAQFWAYQRHHDTPLWKKVAVLCLNISEGHYPEKKNQSSIILGCEEATYAR